MSRILRGDIYWANLNPTIGNEQAGFRPILIISENIFNERSGTIIGLAITSKSQKAGFPLTYKLTTPKLPKESWVKISQVRTLSIKRIGDFISHTNIEELNIIVAGFNEIIGG